MGRSKEKLLLKNGHVPLESKGPVLDLFYWRDPIRSGVVFGTGFLSLLLLVWLSFISVVSYVTLLLLTASMCFRAYKMIMQTINKTQDGHPFKDLMELDITLQPATVHEFVDTVLSKVNTVLLEVRRLLLVDDIVDSIKFGVLLWVCTYVGAWFNGLTLIILGYVTLFTLPKVYEANQSCVDEYLSLVKTQVDGAMTKVKALIPIGQKDKEQ